MVSNDEKNLALLSHVLTFVVGIFAPLIIWLLKKEESAFISEHAKESINFQISMYIYAFVSMILIIVLIGIVMLVALGIFALVVVIQAAIAAQKGESYRYPLTIRLIK